MRISQRLLTLIAVTVVLLLAARALYWNEARWSDLRGYLEMGHVLESGGFSHDIGLATYPPTFAPVLLALAKFEGLFGRLALRELWGLASLAALLLFAWGAAEGVGLGRWGGVARLAALGLVLRSAVADLNNENMTALLAALCVGAVLLQRRGREPLGVALLVVGGAWKLWPLAFLPVMALESSKRLRLVVVAAATGAVILLSTTAVLGGERLLALFDFWLHEVLPNTGGSSVMNQSLLGTLLRLRGLQFDESTAVLRSPEAARLFAETRTLASGLGGLGLALTAATLLRIPVESARRQELRAVAGHAFVLMALVALPLCWVHYLLLGLPLATWLLTREGHGYRLAALLGFLLSQAIDRDTLGPAAWEWTAHHGFGLLGALVWIAASTVGVLQRAEGRKPA